MYALPPKDPRKPGVPGGMAGSNNNACQKTLPFCTHCCILKTAARVSAAVERTRVGSGVRLEPSIRGLVPESQPPVPRAACLGTSLDGLVDQIVLLGLPFVWSANGPAQYHARHGVRRLCWRGFQVRTRAVVFRPAINLHESDSRPKCSVAKCISTISGGSLARFNLRCRS